jgi:hypothetical protein
MQGFPQNIIGQPSAEIDCRIGVGVGLAAAADAFEFFLVLAVVPVYRVL